MVPQLSRKRKASHQQRESRMWHVSVRRVQSVIWVLCHIYPSLYVLFTKYINSFCLHEMTPYQCIIQTIHKAKFWALVICVGQSQQVMTSSFYKGGRGTKKHFYFKTKNKGHCCASTPSMSMQRFAFIIDFFAINHSVSIYLFTKWSFTVTNLGDLSFFLLLWRHQFLAVGMQVAIHYPISIVFSPLDCNTIIPVLVSFTSATQLVPCSSKQFYETALIRTEKQRKRQRNPRKRL